MAPSVRLADVSKNPSELIYYFKTCLALCQQYGKPPMLHHFWLRAAILAGDAYLVYFPCYDTYQEFRRWANAVLTSNEPQVFWDADQGWELEVWQSDDHIYFRRGNLDDRDEQPDCYRFSKLALRGQIERLIHDCVPVFEHISEETGLDFSEIEKSLVPLQANVLQSGRLRDPERRDDQPTKVCPGGSCGNEMTDLSGWNFLAAFQVNKNFWRRRSVQIPITLPDYLIKFAVEALEANRSHAQFFPQKLDNACLAKQHVRSANLELSDYDRSPFGIGRCSRNTGPVRQLHRGIRDWSARLILDANGHGDLLLAHPADGREKPGRPENESGNQGASTEDMALSFLPYPEGEEANPQ